MRIMLPFALALALTLPQAAIAQGIEDEPFAPRVNVTAFAGLGAGPTSSAAWGIAAEVPLHALLGLTAEYSRWGSGIGAVCVTMWPYSYACSVGGWAALAGLAVSGPAVGGVRPFAEVLGGRYSRDQQGTTFRSTALGLGAGAEVPLARGFSLRAGGRYLRPFDDKYEELMGKPLRYTIGTIELRYGIGW